MPINIPVKDYEIFCKLFPQLKEFVKEYRIDNKVGHALYITMKSGVMMYFVYDPKVGGAFTLTTETKVIDSIRGSTY